MSNAFRVLPSPPAPPAATLAALGAHASSNLSDCVGHARTADGAIRARHKGGRLCGPALTVRLPPGDNLMVHKAIDIARPGDVVVIDVGGSLAVAVIGDIMSTLAAKRGVAGIVIDGAIRDSAEIAAGNLPVYARGVSPRGPTKKGPGEINVPVSIGGMVVKPGEIIVGDEDGVVVVAPEEADAVLQKVKALVDREKSILRGIAEGTVDRSWVDAALKANGCEF